MLSYFTSIQFIVCTNCIALAGNIVIKTPNINMNLSDQLECCRCQNIGSYSSFWVVPSEYESILTTERLKNIQKSS